MITHSRSLTKPSTDRLAEVEAETLGDRLAEGEVERLVDGLADRLAEVEARSSDLLPKGKRYELP